MQDTRTVRTGKRPDGAWDIATTKRAIALPQPLSGKATRNGIPWALRQRTAAIGPGRYAKNKKKQTRRYNGISAQSGIIFFHTTLTGHGNGSILSAPTRSPHSCPLTTAHAQPGPWSVS